MEKDKLSVWRKLYDVALKIQELEPWKCMWDLDFTVILLPGYDFPIYCSILGRNDECIGITVYYDMEGVSGLQKFISSNPEYPLAIDYNKYFACYWGSRQEISNKDYKIIKDLGLKFRGKRAWIYFRSFEPKFIPGELSELDAEFLFNILENLYMALNAHIAEGLEVDFENGEMLARGFDEEKNTWITFKDYLMLPQPSYMHAEIEDKFLIARLKKKKRINLNLEVDIANTGIPIREKRDEKGYFLRIFMMADHDGDYIIANEIVLPEFDEYNMMLSVFIEFIKQNGRPISVITRDKYEGVFSDLCDKLKIKLVIKDEPEIIGNFIESFIEMRNGI